MKFKKVRTLQDVNIFVNYKDESMFIRGEKSPKFKKMYKNRKEKLIKIDRYLEKCLKTSDMYGEGRRGQ